MDCNRSHIISLYSSKLLVCRLLIISNKTNRGECKANKQSGIYIIIWFEILNRYIKQLCFSRIFITLGSRSKLHIILLFFSINEYDI